ncbi:MAG: hypothetical protein M1822_006953 [Bathelium mastoideum]|nr:MAG: hypothetical protein M1822_006953 [Bathelium mastoideum]
MVPKFVTAIVCSLTLTYGSEVGPGFPKANYVFNEIHNSARQFGSSLNHNGMAFFIATIPAGTEFYHGTGSAIPVNGMEWLAFEPEHALVFARPGSNRMDLPRNRKSKSAETHDKEFRRNVQEAGSDIQEIAKQTSTDPDNKSLAHGFLHTYRTKHSLRLLYIDGASAAKSDKGTLDLQDLVLLHYNPLYKSQLRNVTEVGEDHIRAARMCRMANERWQGQINGFLRMEAGFEVILCNFEKDLDTVRISQAKGIVGPPGMIADGPAYFKAIAARYHGIGGERVKLDYDNYISLFTYPGVTYVDDTGRPRVDNASTSIEDVLEALDDMVLSEYNTAAASVNWQAVVDMVVAKYADRIENLASGSISTLKEFKTEAERPLRHFIDYSDRNRAEEILRCKEHSVPWKSRHSNATAARAILEVNDIICRALFSITRAETGTLADGVSVARSLQKYLAWTEWKKCKGCNANEFCFVPTWPVGSAEDFEHPRCVSDVRKVGRDYWGGYSSKQRRPDTDVVPDVLSRFRERPNGSCKAGTIFDLRPACLIS